MLHILKKLMRIIPGLLIFSFGIFLSGQSELGYAPWNVLNDGMSVAFPLSFGNATILTGVLIFVLVLLLREPLGIGSVLNLLLVGVFCDMFNWIDAAINLIPPIESFVIKLILCLAAILVTALGSCIYMATQWGAGPRDSLMVAVTRKVPFSYAVCRISIEGTVFAIGWALGGTVGIGSVLNVVLMGPTVGTIFKLLGIDIKRFKNENFADTWRILREAKTAGKN